jgi:hypothetical protein
MLRKATSRVHNVPQRASLWAKVNRNTANPGKSKIPLDKHYSKVDKVSEISGPRSLGAWRHRKQPE